VPVVKLKRGSDVWLLQVGDEHRDPKKNPAAGGRTVEEKALLVANGDGKDFTPGNGKPGWTVASVHEDHELGDLRAEVESP
jgi:hypothetical protein